MSVKKGQQQNRLEDFASLADAVRAVGDRGRVVLCEASKDDWCVNQHGVLVKVGDRFLLNRRELLYEGPCTNWLPHPRGAIIQTGDFTRIRLLLNGRDILYEGFCDKWDKHESGVVVSIRTDFSRYRLLLNGREPALYEGECDEWKSNSQGAVVRIGDRFLQNGRDLLYKGPCHGWRAHPQGVIVREEIGHGDCRLKLNGVRLCTVSKSSGWTNHPKGVITVGHDDRFHDHLCLPGGEELYYGPICGYCWHKWGLIVDTSHMSYGEIMLVVAPGTTAQLECNPVDSFGPNPDLVVPDWIQKL